MFDKFVQAVMCYHSFCGNNNYEWTSSRIHTQYHKLFDKYINSYRKAKIETKDELAMFLTQVIWESCGLVHKEEINPPKHGYRVLGDPENKSYHGRGYIQLTGSENYKAFSKYYYKGNERKLYDEPELVATDEDVAWGSTFWYWSWAVHDDWSKGFEFTTKAINPNYECLCGPDWVKAEKRFKLYTEICGVLGNLKPIGEAHWECHHSNRNPNPLKRPDVVYNK